MIIKKIILIGEIGVGKTSIARRLAFDPYGDGYKATLGADIYRYEVIPPPIADTPFHFLVWDTDGSHGDHIFRQVYVRQAQAALFVADVSRPTTIDTMLRLGERYESEMPGRYFAHVLNKLDLVGDAVAEDIEQRLAASSVPWFRLSAKTGSNVRDAFHRSATAIVRLEGKDA